MIINTLVNKVKSKGKGKQGKDDSGQHGEDIREHHHELKSLGKGKGKSKSEDWELARVWVLNLS